MQLGQSFYNQPGAADAGGPTPPSVDASVHWNFVFNIFFAIC